MGLKLHWSLVSDTKFVLLVLAATWNDDLWNPDRFPYENKWDESDFEERKSRYDAPELITAMLDKCKLNFSTGVFDHTTLPKITNDVSRKYAASAFCHRNAKII